MADTDKQDLEARAKREGISMGELIRRAASVSRGEEGDALAAALTALRRSNATASAALDQALAAMTEREADWPRREREAVARGQALAAAWTEARR